MEYLDLAKSMRNCTLNFMLVHSLWDEFNIDVKTILNDQSGWKEFKYIQNGDINKIANKVPSNKGGIYSFYIKSDILKNKHDFLVYIGRAQKTNKQNLRKRIKEYIQYYKDPDSFERPKLRNIFKEWGEYIYCRYFVVDNSIQINNKMGNDLIKFIEEELINTLLPPANDRIPNVIISAARSAFN